MRRKVHGFIPERLAVVIIAPLLAVALIYNGGRAIMSHGDTTVSDKTIKTIEAFAQKHDLKKSDWPDNLIALMDNNPDAEEFVLNYPLKKDQEQEISLSELVNRDSVPLLFQWDGRWGYSKYSGELMGLSGCGPTCLSMVSIYLTGEAEYSPRYIADFSEKNGYNENGKGSKWTLISEGGEKLGLDVTELPLDEKTIVDSLENGNPIICVVGPGDFTTTDHFIVMTGYEDGKIKINDHNSKVRSEKLWDYEDIKGQIKNLWACKKAQ